jgi:hypothetical protein
VVAINYRLIPEAMQQDVARTSASVLTSFGVAVIAFCGAADVKMPAMFIYHAVLQRDIKLPI